jgi:hypothetical protein
VNSHPRDVVHVHAAAMGFDDAAGNGEPESGSRHRLGPWRSRRLAAEPHVGQPGKVGIGDAIALIAHPDNGGGGVVVAKHGSNSNVDRAVGVGVPDRVGDQVRERSIPRVGRCSVIRKAEPAADRRSAP